ncbi:MAG: DNA polymerase III subunit gamma/tau [Clostridia bacterium]|nr:DNA polymerase III subunit gamma/tau [Clostridia bacterium]
MHQALYRKYRPFVFDDVYGQEHITSILRHEATHNSTSHAYLFAGSRGTGKTTCAKILAKVVNCLNPKDGNPCNECENCKAIDTATTTDVIEMDAATNTGVDYIRDLRDNVMYTPAMLKKRVYIIDEAHMLSDSAFNALLKTIEEPPEHVLYIFATTEPHKIPATIISRCQRFEFRRISVKSLVERLMYIASCENIDLTEEGATLIAKAAQGGMRDAISLMELCAGSHDTITGELVNNILGTSPYDKMCTVAKNIAEKKYSLLFDTINDIVVSSKDVLVFFGDLTAFYRDMMIQKSSGSAKYLELLPQEAKLLEQTASLFNMATLIYHASLLDDAYSNMMRNPASKRLIAEITLMKMCDPKLSDSNDAILSRLASLEDKVKLLSKGVINPVTADIPSNNESSPIREVESDEEIANEPQNQAIEDKQENDNTVEKQVNDASSSARDNSYKLDNWDEIIQKVEERDAAVGSFLKSCDCIYSEKNNKYYIFTTAKLMATMLAMDKNKKAIFDAMLCCDMSIDSYTQIEIVFKKSKTEKSDLDIFN